jgi:hypothetical protein
MSNVYGSVLRQINYMRDNNALTEANEALGELALCLATTLDAGAGLATAAVARELRSTLQEIAKTIVKEDEDWDEFISGIGTPRVTGISALGNPS